MLSSTQRTSSAAIVIGVLCVLFIGIDAVAPSTCALEVPVFPAADTYTDAARPTFTYGSDSTLQLRSSPTATKNREAYLKFYLPIGATRPTAAKLSLYGASDSETTAANVIVTGMNTNDWSEDGLNAETAPSCLQCPSVSFRAPSTAGWSSVDVLSIVNSALASGKSVVSFSVSLDRTGVASFHSAEAASLKPMLLLSYPSH